MKKISSYGGDQKLLRSEKLYNCMSDYTGACLKGVYGVAQPSLKALVSSRCRLLCIKLDYDFYLRKRIPTF